MQRRRVSPSVRGAILGNTRGSAEHVEPSSCVAVRKLKPHPAQESPSSELRVLGRSALRTQNQRAETGLSMRVDASLYLGQWPQRQPWGEA